MRPTTDIFVYKPFIDGLRAISILSVVTFHAGLPGISGGFVGVDVFFVISGYLIINQIVAGLKSEKFSFAEFWARRVLRILPPYLLVIGTCLAIAPLILVTPAEFAELGEEAKYSALMVVNYYFLGQEGYFDLAAETKPLLNLWSLAVEEQFYLVAPVMAFCLFWLAKRLGRFGLTFWISTAAAMAVASFVFCVFRSHGATNAAFYLTPFRAWEFLLGGAIPLFVLLLRRLPVFAGEIVGWAGLGLISWAVIAFDNKTPYPSYSALMPVAGACLIILAGLAWPTNRLARLLAIRPLVWIGVISYSWYLWHWPLLTFGRIYNFGDSIPAWDWGAIVFSLLLAALTHYWVELPIKRWRQRRDFMVPHWRIVAAGIGGASAVSLVGLAYVAEIAPATARSLPPSFVTERTWPGPGEPSPGDICVFSTDRPKKLNPECLRNVVDKPIGTLIGNSHAGMIYQTVRDQAASNSTVLVTLMTRCKPYVPIEGFRYQGGRKCPSGYDAGLSTLNRVLDGRQPDFAILSANWIAAKPGSPAKTKKIIPHLEALGLKETPPDGLSPDLTLGLVATIDRLNDLGVKRILIVGPIPKFHYDPRTCVLRAKHIGADLDKCSVSRRKAEQARSVPMSTLRFVARQFPGVLLIDPLDVFCDQKMCRPYEGDTVFYSNGSHLNDYGARRLFGAFEGSLLWAFRGGTSPPAHAAADGSPVRLAPVEATMTSVQNNDSPPRSNGR